MLTVMKLPLNCPKCFKPCDDAEAALITKLFSEAVKQFCARIEPASGQSVRQSGSQAVRQAGGGGGVHFSLL